MERRCPTEGPAFPRYSTDIYCIPRTALPVARLFSVHKAPAEKLRKHHHNHKASLFWRSLWRNKKGAKPPGARPIVWPELRSDIGKFGPATCYRSETKTASQAQQLVASGHCCSHIQRRRIWSPLARSEGQFLRPSSQSLVRRLVAAAFTGGLFCPLGRQRRVGRD